MKNTTIEYDPLTKCPLCQTYVLKSSMKALFGGTIEVCTPCFNAWKNQKE